MLHLEPSNLIKKLHLTVFIKPNLNKNHKPEVQEKTPMFKI